MIITGIIHETPLDAIICTGMLHAIAYTATHDRLNNIVQ